MRKAWLILGLSMSGAMTTILAPSHVGSMEGLLAIPTVGPSSAKGSTNAGLIANRKPINGAVTPELVPENAAYLLFFNFIASRRTT